MQAAWTATVGIALSLVCTPAGAQSLVDAAKRAEETRKANSGTAVAFDERDVNPLIAAREVLTFAIDEQRWKIYVAADNRVMDLLEKDPALYTRIEHARPNSARMIERFLMREPVLLKALEASGTNPHEYAYTSVAIGLAMAVIANDPGPAILEQLPDATRANMAFVRAHDAEVKELVARGERLRERATKTASAPAANETGAKTRTDTNAAPPPSPKPGDGVVFTRPPRKPTGTFAYEIDEGQWQRFLAADKLVAAAYEADPALYARVGLAPLEVGDGERLTGLITREPALVKVLQAAGSNPREYAYTSLALNIAVEIAFEKPLPELLEMARTAAVKANVAFVRARESEVREQVARERALYERMKKK